MAWLDFSGDPDSVWVSSGAESGPPGGKVLVGEKLLRAGSSMDSCFYYVMMCFLQIWIRGIVGQWRSFYAVAQLQLNGSQLLQSLQRRTRLG